MIEGEGCHLVLVVAVLGRSAGRIVAKMGKEGGRIDQRATGIDGSQINCNPSATNNCAAELDR